MKGRIQRKIYDQIKEACFQGRIIVLYGARQVGKTTMLKKLIRETDVPCLWLNADESDILTEISEAKTSSRLLQIFGENNKLVIIDEAQQIPDIGKKLKLVYDTKPELQIIVTGSSTLDLLNYLNEPLTGRKTEFHLYPFSFQELTTHSNLIEEKRQLHTRLLYGSYPAVQQNPGKEKEILTELSTSYLYKDVLKLGGVRKPAIIEKLLQALSFQVGNEVKYHEIAQLIGNIDPATVERYLDLLEKAFVIYKLPALSRNLRNEMKKGKKYYFYDNGIRNVIIRNFSPIELRNDTGALWENYLMSERIKWLEYEKVYCNKYFWRTHDQAEIDYIEERDGMLHATEFKWRKKKSKFPQSFQDAYQQNTLSVVHQTNYENFIS